MKNGIDGSYARRGTPLGLSDGATLERAFSMVNEAMFTIALQVRRLRSDEPEDATFIFRWWADLQFLIVALRRLRAAARVAERVRPLESRIRKAVLEFDEALPGLRVMRNVGEHAASYALDIPSRHHPEVDRYQLHAGTWDGETYTWLVDEGGIRRRLVLTEAKSAAELLFKRVSSLVRGWTAANGSEPAEMIQSPSPFHRDCGR